MSHSPLLGLISGLAIIVLTLIVVGVVNLPQAEGADGVASPRQGCHRVIAQADQGYGIGGRVERQVCD